MTTAELQRIVELGKAATARPWCRDNYVVRHGDSPGVIHIYEAGEDDGPLFSSSLGTPEDALYIAAAANSADKLAAALLRIGEIFKDLPLRIESAEMGCSDHVVFTLAEASELLRLLGRE